MESREKGFSDVAVRIFHGAELTPLSEPLSYFAYPLLATTLFGWAWGTIEVPPNRPPQPTSGGQ